MTNQSSGSPLSPQPHKLRIRRPDLDVDTKARKILKGLHIVLLSN